MGKFTVDLKHKKLYVTMDKFNASHYRQVLQGSTHERTRPDAYLKHSEALPIERDGAEGSLGRNFLGKAWCHKKGFKPDEDGNYRDFPSLYEVFIWIKLEATL
jgi:hypothetical protein